MHIRPVIPQDKDQILTLLRQRGTFNEGEIQLALEVLDEALAHPERQDYYVFCGLSPEGVLAAYICFGPIPITDGRYDLYWIAADEKLARKGFAGRLVDFMEKFLAQKDARRIYIDTSSTPGYRAARSFYQKHGFQPECVLRNFYRNGDDKIIFMKKVGRDRKQVAENVKGETEGRRN